MKKMIKEEELTRENKIFRMMKDDIIREVFCKVPNLLAMLLSSCLNIPYEELKQNIKIDASVKLPKRKINTKSSTCDFLVNLGNNLAINVEINSQKAKGIEQRNIVYLCKILQNMIPEATKYEHFEDYKAWQLNINNFSDNLGTITSQAYALG